MAADFVTFRDSSPFRYQRSVQQIQQLGQVQISELSRVESVFKYRSNTYYNQLIDWSDPKDPLRQLIVPQTGELKPFGSLDASDESSNTVVPGCQHKYSDTALVLCSNLCGGYCRYCFRKRLFMDDNDEVGTDLAPAFDYIANHPEISNVLLTGGDPLVLGTSRIKSIMEPLCLIPHVKILRIGSKMLAFNPWRILHDAALMELFRSVGSSQRKLYIITHFDHPRELTSAARDAIAACQAVGIVMANQCPIIRGVNDQGTVLGELFQELASVGCPQYYCFQGRPTTGNEPFTVPIVQSFAIFQEAMNRGSGLASRARFVLSHSTGKVEVVGIDDGFIYFRYHRARRAESRGGFFRRKRNDEVCWLDDLELA